VAKIHKLQNISKKLLFPSLIFFPTTAQGQRSLVLTRCRHPGLA